MRPASLLCAAIVLAGCAAGPPRGRFREPSMRNAESYRPRTQRSTPPSATPDALLLAGFDLDGDLIVSEAEIARGISREFARADGNRDGVISAAEFDAWASLALGGPYTPRWSDFDANEDSRITPDEFTAELRSLVHQYDINADGVLDHAELVRPGGSIGDDEPSGFDNSGPPRGGFGGGAGGNGRPPRH